MSEMEDVSTGEAVEAVEISAEIKEKTAEVVINRTLENNREYGFAVDARIEEFMGAEVVTSEIVEGERGIIGFSDSDKEVWRTRPRGFYPRQGSDFREVEIRPIYTVLIPWGETSKETTVLVLAQTETEVDFEKLPAGLATEAGLRLLLHGVMTDAKKRGLSWDFLRSARKRKLDEGEE